MPGSIFTGQFGGFGGGMIGGQGGQSAQQGMQFGGGFMMNPHAQPAIVQPVQVVQGGQVTYAVSTDQLRSQDRRAGMMRRKRY